ncbi:MAG: phosphoenolpyruvate--protein phosphotransferase [Polyangiaceae bacterium]|nr:phosphoenolpyruvate--protein phosphotransferase [Polyangiaceae bacterium]MCW5791215.1 phosphoenolpyruvate--protein phosphotransferase [Polyangiaceae bacterium]
MRGVAASPGVRLGVARVLTAEVGGEVERRVPRSRVAAEVRRLRAAVSRATAELRAAAQGAAEGAVQGAAEGAARELGSAEASILEAYLMLMEDEGLLMQIEAFIREQRATAAWATRAVTRALAARLAEQPNSYLAERAHDLEFIGREIVAALAVDVPVRQGQELTRAAEQGAPEPRGALGALEPVSVAGRLVVAEDISPTELVRWASAPPLGLITALGGSDSHTAILARAMGLPAVVGVGSALMAVREGESLLIDGERGEVWRSPSQARVARALSRASVVAPVEEPLGGDATACGVAIELQVNLEGLGGLAAALEQGAAGVGLYRSELMCLGWTRLPSEEEQYELYRALVEGAAPRTVTLRTFDFGADKPYPGAARRWTPPNPALGLRGVRLALATPELLPAQLRAMARAAAHGSARVLIPMVSQVDEFEQVRALWREAAEQGGQAPLGVMIEVPAAAVLAEVWCERADFLCLGTNDLAQYTLAADRTDPEVAARATALDPAVLRLIRQVSQAAAAAERPLSVCGALASEPLGAALLVGLGVRALSVEPGQLLRVRAALRRLRLRAAEEAAAAALRQVDAVSVRRELEARLGAVLRGPRGGSRR